MVKANLFRLTFILFLVPLNVYSWEKVAVPDYVNKDSASPGTSSMTSRVIIFLQNTLLTTKGQEENHLNWLKKEMEIRISKLL